MRAFPTVAKLLSLAITFSAIESRLTAQRQPDCQTGCNNYPVQIVGWTFTPVIRQVETGPFTYTVTIFNPTAVAANIQVSCLNLSPQLPCSQTPSPATFLLAAGNYQNVTVGYRTMGIGNFRQRIVAINLDTDGGRTSDTSDIGLVTTSGVPIGTILYPVSGGQLAFGDTLRTQFYHASGVDSSTFKLFIDSADSTGNSHVHKTISTMWASGLALAVKTHNVRIYGCALNGRCDSVPSISFIAIGSPPTWSMDDSLPPPTSAQGGFYGTLPGALPLPAVSLRGCPVNLDEPLISLQSPTGSVSQGGTPSGLIFVPSVSYDTALVVATLNHDYKASDNTTCSDGVHFFYLNEIQYDWNFWTIQETPQSDSLWAVYPYGDCVQCGHNPSSPPPPAPPIGLRGIVVPDQGNSEATPGRPHPAWPRPFQPWKHPFGFPHIENPGAINPSTFTLKLNGTLIVNNDQVVSGYATVVTKVASDLTGQTYRINQSISLMHRYDPLNPTADSGGWNTLQASIADSTNHRSTVQTRFVQVKAAQPKDIQLTAMKDFRWLNQGDCAAFGMFQCGSVMLTQTIPGFVTRDKDRSLHLVYQSGSQRAPTILPYQLFVSALQATPDSVWVFAKEGTNSVGDTTRYVGGKKPTGDPDTVATLWNFTNEKRVVSALLNPPTDTSRAKIRTITAALRAFYGATVRDNTVNATQEVVQLYRADTVMARFGQGWTLAEQSRLFLTNLTSQGAPAAVWYEGDGSYTIFRKVSNVWVSPTWETARLYDSLLTTGLTSRYMIALSNGATIGFTATGWQQYTADMIGNKTTYGYAGNRLISITDPSGMYFEFQYNYASGGGLGQVSDIFLHGTSGSPVKIATFTYNTVGRLAQAKIWRSATAGDSTRFGYLTTAPGAFLDSITDPRSPQTPNPPSNPAIVTTVAYDGWLYTPTQVIRPQAHPFETAMNAQFRDHWRRTAPRVGHGKRSNGSNDPWPERLVYTTQLRGTLLGFDVRPTDFTVGPFSGTTFVRRISPPPVMTQDFLTLTYGGDDVRRITRDTLGRVTKIVSEPDSTTTADSVIYRYDALSRLDTIIRNTAVYPVPAATLDTVRFAYDSVTISGKAWCSRLRSMYDASGGRDTVVFPTSGTVAKCLPTQMVGIALDTTWFTYGPLTVGDKAATRPASVKDQTGVTRTMSYNNASWNSYFGTRTSDNAIDSAFYDAFGWVDSTKDAVHTRLYVQKDLSGRVVRSKSGMGSLVPTSLTYYNPAGLVDSVSIYASNDATLLPIGGAVIQTTRNYYDRLGQVDSTKSSGGRRQFFTRDNRGNPVFEYTANGSYILRMYDWQGRVTYENQSPVGPDYSTNGDAFADAATVTAYRGLGMVPGSFLTLGQVHQFVYNNKGQVASIASTDVYSGLLLTRGYKYSRTGQLIGDSLHFINGPTVVRGFSYDRRGQRRGIATAITGVTIPEPDDSLRYFFNPSTARLDSIRQDAYASWGGADSAVGRVRWKYDLAGRDTLRGILLGTGTGLGGTELLTHFQYDVSGRLSQYLTQAGSTSWYQMSAPSFSKIDELLAYSAIEPSGLVPNTPISRTRTYTYSTDGTRRLVNETVNNGSPERSDAYSYDVFGNRYAQTPFTAYTNQGCEAGVRDTLVFGTDNELKRRQVVPCNSAHAYLNDKAGNRLVQYDTVNGVGQGPQNIMSYTAKNQLFFSLSTTAGLGTYDYNWNWYDASGLRTITQATTYNGWGSISGISGPKTYYVYDGNDVALMILYNGTSWFVRGRYLTGGLDQPLAGRFANTTGTQMNLGLVVDWQGTTMAALHSNATQESDVSYLARSAYGNFETLIATQGGTNPQAGYAGASTPNMTGGFVYLRNRWYDPKTGRFLTQDPIGLAGGVNLYSYAGNNPIAFFDPFGLQGCTVDHPEECKWFSFTAGGSAGPSGHIGLGPLLQIKGGVEVGAQHEVSWGPGPGLTHEVTGSVSASAQVSIPAASFSVGPSYEYTCQLQPSFGDCHSSGISVGGDVEHQTQSGDKTSADASAGTNGDLSVKGGIGNSTFGVTFHARDFGIALVGYARQASKALQRMFEPKNGQQDQPKPPFSH